MPQEGPLFGEWGKRPEEGKHAGLVQLDQSGEEDAAEQCTQSVTNLSSGLMTARTVRVATVV